MLDVRTQAGYGANTRDELKKALSYSQDPEHVDAHIQELVARGGLSVSGDAVTLTEQGRSRMSGRWSRGPDRRMRWDPR